MKSKFYTVLKRDKNNSIVSRIGSFTTKEVADKLSDNKNENRTAGDLNESIFYDVAWSDLYETLDEYLVDETEALNESARKKLTAEEWSAVRYLATNGCSRSDR